MSEKAILVGVKIAGIKDGEFNYSFEELAALAKSAGAIVCDAITQSRTSPDVSTYIGKGKIDELKQLVEQSQAELVIFDNDLTGSQVRNIEKAIEVRVIDRTELILDIFAQRAHTSEAKLQVELAQLNYLFPRLIGLGVLMSRLGGGIGTRGPGETELEYDRRRIKRRISHLNKDIQKVAKVRKEQRKARQKFPIAALVGYTNAGKSTLLKTLTKTDVTVEDRLFTTLDTKISKFTLNKHQALLLIDTVGFIQNLPHHLVSSFRATLEEVQEADILLHIVDVSSPYLELQMDSVQTVLKQLDVLSTPVVTVFNKIDKLDDANQISKWLNKTPYSVALCALSGENIDQLVQTLLRMRIEKNVGNRSPQ
ncbi:MAG: GTPase HflX [bacterium]